MGLPVQILTIWSPWMLVLGKSIGRLVSLAPAMREKKDPVGKLRFSERLALHCVWLVYWRNGSGSDAFASDVY